MQPAPLQLNRCFIGAVNVRPNEERPSTNLVTVTVTPTFGRHERIERDWMVTLQVHFEGAEGKAAPYSGDVEVQGFFSVDPAYPAEKTNKMLAVTCPSMLYATVRELVSTLSARGKHGTFLLPSVSFTDHDLIVQALPEPEAKTMLALDKERNTSLHARDKVERRTN